MIRTALSLLVFLALNMSSASAQDYSISGFVRVTDLQDPITTYTASNDMMTSSNQFIMRFCEIVGNETPTPPGEATMNVTKDSGPDASGNVQVIFRNTNGSDMICEYMFEWDVDGTSIAGKTLRSDAVTQTVDRDHDGSVTLLTSGSPPLAAFESMTDGATVGLDLLNLGSGITLSGEQYDFRDSGGAIAVPEGQTTKFRIHGRFVISAGDQAVLTTQIQAGAFVNAQLESWGALKAQY